MRFLAAAYALVALSTAAMAEVTYPVDIPGECYAIADREGVSHTIQNRYQGIKAKARLYRLSKSDPDVASCRAAIERAKEASK